ncbi:uncharacterized protein LOC143558747 [Bidens hawaiensis]|uniref:uncharacterized protein LOC143558747 n=1 Tax=Bidens hawaiensis TaxID=980011 RepID=UPI0040493344
MAEEEEDQQPKDNNNNNILSPNTNTLIARERIHLPSFPTQSLPDPTSGQRPWSTTTVVFPPTNHEGLNLHHQFDVPDTHVDPVKVKPSPPVVTLKPPAIGLPVKWWFLRFKLTGILSSIWNRMNFPMIGSTVVVFLWYLRLRRRRQRLRSRVEAVDELLAVIKEKDERIHQLLHQIARMNELLLASHHGVPMISKATSS